MSELTLQSSYTVATIQNQLDEYLFMDGDKIRSYLKRKGVTVGDAALAAGLSRSAFHALLNKSELTEAQHESLIKKLSLPENFFSGPTQIGDNGATQTMTVGLAECEKELAVMKERVAQLELRLQEKDDFIATLKGSKK